MFKFFNHTCSVHYDYLYLESVCDMNSYHLHKHNYYTNVVERSYKETALMYTFCTFLRYIFIRFAMQIYIYIYIYYATFQQYANHN